MPNDLRYALRTLRRSPGFAASAILALALGIGANTAVFSVVYAVLLKPLPYPGAEQIVRLYEANPAQGIERGGVSPGTFVDWRARSRTLESLGVYTRGEALWSFGDEPDVVRFSAVSPAIFSLLRVGPVLGRTFRPEAEQDKPAGDSGQVVISYGLAAPLWRGAGCRGSLGPGRGTFSAAEHRRHATRFRVSGCHRRLGQPAIAGRAQRRVALYADSA